MRINTTAKIYRCIISDHSMVAGVNSRLEAIQRENQGSSLFFSLTIRSAEFLVFIANTKPQTKRFVEYPGRCTVKKKRNFLRCRIHRFAANIFLYRTNAEK